MNECGFCGNKNDIHGRLSVHMEIYLGNGVDLPKPLCRMISEYDDYRPHNNHMNELLRKSRRSIRRRQRARYWEHCPFHKLDKDRNERLKRAGVIDHRNSGSDVNAACWSWKCILFTN